jgi:GNAT superfamily N-acetyltransferase
MLTGADFREEHVLDDGTPVVLRHIRPEDAAELKRGFERLSPPSRYRRFFAAMGSLPDKTVHYLTHVDGRDHVAIVAATRERPDGPEIGLGVARFIRTAEDPSVAEAALTVIDAFQRRGLGRILAIALARAALERKITRFRGEILVDNDAVRHLLEEVDARLETTSDGEVVFEVDLAPSAPGVGERLERVVRRVLRAAATRLGG